MVMFQISGFYCKHVEALHSNTNSSGGSMASHNEYLAPTLTTIPCIETQSPRNIGTWTLKTYVPDCASYEM